MNSIDHDSGAKRNPAEVSVQDAEPYRTPQNVPDETPRRGLLGSPIAWALAAGVMLGGIAIVLAWRSTRTNVINYVEDFGLERRGPIEPREESVEAMAVEYDASIQTESSGDVPQP